MADPLVRRITLYHGGIVREMPAVGRLDFSTDRALAEQRAARWGEHGHVLEARIDVNQRWHPLDRRWHYLPNMPMVRLPHRQYTYQSGSFAACIQAKRAALAALGVPMQEAR